MTTINAFGPIMKLHLKCPQNVLCHNHDIITFKVMFEDVMNRNHVAIFK